MRGGNNMPEDRDESEQFRKLFVGGLHFETTEKTLREYFEQYGEIVDCVVMRDSNTQRSRGFGFITFKTAEMLDEAQKGRPHRIDDKDVETKRAMPREEAGRPDIHVMSKKLYVSGVKDGLEEDDLREYFSHYGNVDSVEIITDKATGQRRGFAFVSFEDYDPVDKIVLTKSHNIKDRRCDVKKAMSKEEMQQAKFGPVGGRGGRGRGFDSRRDMSYGGGRSDYEYRRGGGDYAREPYDSYRGGRGAGSSAGYGSSGYGYGGTGGGRDGYRRGDDYGRSMGGGGYQAGGGYSGAGGYGGGRDMGGYDRNGGGYGGRDYGGYGGGRDAGYGSGRDASGYGGGRDTGYDDRRAATRGGGGGYEDRSYGSGNSGTGSSGFGSGYGNSAGGGPMRGGYSSTRAADGYGGYSSGGGGYSSSAGGPGGYGGSSGGYGGASSGGYGGGTSYNRR